MIYTVTLEDCTQNEYGTSAVDSWSVFVTSDAKEAELIYVCCLALLPHGLDAVFAGIPELDGDEVPDEKDMEGSKRDFCVMVYDNSDPDGIFPLVDCWD